MVPNLSKGTGIKGTALYVLHDVRDEGDRAIGAELTPDRQTSERVGMTATRNLSTDNPELAWRLMCATAANRDALKQAAGVHKGGRPGKYQCGHLSLSWEHATRPDRAEMLRAAEGALTALGWEKLQALIVEHRDHEHAHCHIVVNLIDPETGRSAPNAKNDFEKVQRWAHQYDKARGIEACPNRAERMERAPEDPSPPEPAKRWLSRKEFEAIREAERAEHRAQALDRYRAAAAQVREEFSPAWRELYRQQRTETRMLRQEQFNTMRELGRASVMRRALSMHPDRQAARATGADRQRSLAQFVNQHRAEIWRGFEGHAQPGNNAALLSPRLIRETLQRVHEADRAALLGQHKAAKDELKAQHDEARQNAYRAAWQRPASAEVVPFSKQPEAAAESPGAPDRGKTGWAAALAITGAGLAAYALKRSREQGELRDPQRDLDQAADRIARQQSRAANANRRQPDTAQSPAREADAPKSVVPQRVTASTPDTPKAPDRPQAAAPAAGARAPRSELDELRAQADARNEAARQARLAAAERHRGRGFDRERSRD